MKLDIENLFVGCYCVFINGKELLAPEHITIDSTNYKIILEIQDFSALTNSTKIIELSKNLNDVKNLIKADLVIQLVTQSNEKYNFDFHSSDMTSYYNKENVVLEFRFNPTYFSIKNATK